MVLTVGQVIHNRYRIVKLLGQGGFGAVYRAWDTKLNGPCAVKENFDSSPEAEQQFSREASMLFNLRHPGLPRVFDFFSIHGKGQYLVMDFIEGEDLQSILDQKGYPLPESRVIPWINQICDALSFLHSQNPAIIHRDLKPANIRITPQGSAVLVDFGTAKVYNPQLKTTIGARAVTPGFSPPEQYGQGRTDARTDIYALGATLYTLLTGKEAADSVDLLTGNAPPLLSAVQLNARISPHISAVIEKAMQLDRQHRFQNIDDFKAALEHKSAYVPSLVPSRPKVSKFVASGASSTPRVLGIGLGIASVVIVGLIAVVILLVNQISNDGVPSIVSALPTKSLRPTSIKPTEVPAPPGKVEIRWFIGLGTGADPAQVEAEQAVVEAFNASQDHIEVILDVVPYENARDSLKTRIAGGKSPDIVGPMGLYSANEFYGMWMDLTPLIEAANFDTSVYNKALVRFLQTEEGQVGLPWMVYPTALYYQPNLFDEGGLNYPPANIGDPYVWPDGTQEAWTWDTLTRVAKQLTLDTNGLTPLDNDFDRDQIVQVGYHPQWSSITVIGTFFVHGVPYTGSPGAYLVAIPQGWKDAWRWYFEGIWGDEPFIINGDLEYSPEFGNGNVFNSGHAAMTQTQLWLTCCIVDAGEWDIASFPSHQGRYHGRMDVDTVYILKYSQHPEAAFEFMRYLIGPGGTEALVMGSADQLPAYGEWALPALPEYQEIRIEKMAKKYPFVTNWDIFLQALTFPDIPSAEAWRPNYLEANTRLSEFGDLLKHNGSVDFDIELSRLEDDLEIIYNK